MPELNENFLRVLREHTAGDPQRETVRWTNLTKKDLVAHMAKTSTPVGRRVVAQLLARHRYRKRQARKSLPMGHAKGRNAQFEKIARLREEFWDSPNPILSMDTKKKEYLGTYYREGQLYTVEALLVYDHDFAHAATGVIYPHSLYDLKRNVGHLYLGLNHDTSEFACDNVFRWWQTFGRIWYPRADSVLLLCDCGGSNDYRRYVFKEQLQRLAEKIQLAVRVAHYPPYTSKYNPIEHRLFPHVTRACQGVIFDSISTVVELMRNTRTSKGLRVTVRVVPKFYATGQACSPEFKAAMPIRFDEDLPRWNYRAVPTPAIVRRP
jgi:hypothetical protein